jgi:hypothetical protein
MTLSARSAPPTPRPRPFVKVSRRAETRRPAHHRESAAVSAPFAEIGRIPAAGDRSASAPVTLQFEFVRNFQPNFPVNFPNLNLVLN